MASPCGSRSLKPARRIATTCSGQASTNNTSVPAAASFPPT
ncbi:hypothetical protein L535_3503 [Bordetella bronchiseptica SBL-F6116]|nr:hypothetical protein L535_3503 [Bordetella bronchiseptica SBL-F6116]